MNRWLRDFAIMFGLIALMSIVVGVAVAGVVLLFAEYGEPWMIVPFIVIVWPSVAAVAFANDRRGKRRLLG